ncbi:MAG TPA: glycosyl hydrolase family 28 protein [Opitutales bacterium]|nr:glycosyl hydrolase family 28 protein [Opitutales bacterium]
MKKFLLLAALLASLVLPVFADDVPVASVPAKTGRKRYVISELGAAGDGATDNTKAIQSVIDQCAAAGGGVIVVPAGTFLSGALFFKQGVDLLVEKDGVLKSTTDVAEFPAIYTRWEGIERYWTCAFLNFVGMHDVEVSGEGTIDGSGVAWMGAGGARGRGGPGFGAGGNASGLSNEELATINKAFRNLLADDPAAKAILDKYASNNWITGSSGVPGGRGVANPSGPAPDPAQFYVQPYPTTATINLAASRTNLPPVNAAGVRVPGSGLAPPRALVFQNCANVRVSGLHLLNEARWGFVFIYCQNVVAEKLAAFTETRIPSSDGMDIDSCKRVLVSQCGFDDGDDDISIKSGKDEDGRRVGIPCEDVIIQSCRFGRGDGGAAMGSETSGIIRNIIVRDCVADARNAAPVRIKTNFTRGGIIENITYENIKFDDVQRCYEINLEWSATSSSGPRMPPVLRNVKIINCSGLADSAGVIHGLPDSLISNLTFENCHVTTYTGLTIDNVTDDVKAAVQGDGLKIDAENGRPIVWRTATGALSGAELTGAAPEPAPADTAAQ